MARASESPLAEPASVRSSAVRETSLPPSAAPRDCGLEALDAMLLGGALPPAVEAHLREAGLAYSDSRAAEAHLDRAKAQAPDHPAVVIARYRYLFYKNRLAEALEVARECLALAARGNGLAQDWRKVAAGDAEFARFEAATPRFYLFTLKAYAYLLLRLGRAEEGRAVVEKLIELDSSDRVGGRVLLDVIETRSRPGDLDE